MGNLSSPPNAPLPRRVVISGIGLVSPLGIGQEQNWASVLAGKVGSISSHGLMLPSIPPR